MKKFVENSLKHHLLIQDSIQTQKITAVISDSCNTWPSCRKCVVCRFESQSKKVFLFPSIFINAISFASIDVRIHDTIGNRWIRDMCSTYRLEPLDSWYCRNRALTVEIYRIGTKFSFPLESRVTAWNQLRDSKWSRIVIKLDTYARLAVSSS